MMETQSTIQAVRAKIHQWRQSKLKIAFVPTMGNLHAGHIKLLTTAKQHADKVVVSIFVNPAQFGPNEDFFSYPRTESQDSSLLKAAGADLLFMPAVAEIYPHQLQTQISVSPLSKMYCGITRPVHFDGVALVVCKLLNIVQPDLLLLGEKDFQQLTIIRVMTSELNIPVEVLGVATVREADGLAMSSRNSYLTPDQRQLAPMLFQSLCAVREEILSGARDYPDLISHQALKLREAGFNLEYYDICRKDDLSQAEQNDEKLLILLAAKLGKTRLIDNIYLQVQP